MFPKLIKEDCKLHNDYEILMMWYKWLDDIYFSRDDNLLHYQKIM